MPLFILLLLPFQIPLLICKFHDAYIIIRIYLYVYAGMRVPYFLAIRFKSEPVAQSINVPRPSSRRLWSPINKLPSPISKIGFLPEVAQIRSFPPPISHNSYVVFSPHSSYTLKYVHSPVFKFNEPSDKIGDLPALSDARLGACSDVRDFGTHTSSTGALVSVLPFEFVVVLF